MFCLNRESCLMGGAGSLPVDSLGASRAVRRYRDNEKSICSSPGIFFKLRICSSPRIFYYINVAD